MRWRELLERSYVYVGVDRVRGTFCAAPFGVPQIAQAFSDRLANLGASAHEDAGAFVLAIGRGPHGCWALCPGLRGHALFGIRSRALHLACFAKPPAARCGVPSRTRARYMQAWIPVSLTPSSILRRRCAALCWARTWRAALRRVAPLPAAPTLRSRRWRSSCNCPVRRGKQLPRARRPYASWAMGRFAQLNAMACVVDPAFDEDILPAQAWLLAFEGAELAGRRAAVRREAARRRGRLRGVAGGSALPSAWPPRSPATFPGRLPQPGSLTLSQALAACSFSRVLERGYLDMPGLDPRCAMSANRLERALSMQRMECERARARKLRSRASFENTHPDAFRKVAWGTAMPATPAPPRLTVNLFGRLEVKVGDVDGRIGAPFAAEGPLSACPARAQPRARRVARSPGCAAVARVERIVPAKELLRHLVAAALGAVNARRRLPVPYQAPKRRVHRSPPAGKRRPRA